MPLKQMLVTQNEVKKFFQPSHFHLFLSSTLHFFSSLYLSLDPAAKVIHLQGQRGGSKATKASLCVLNSSTLPRIPYMT